MLWTVMTPPSRAAHKNPSKERTNMEASRYNIYGAVHKGLRAMMADTLQRMGSTDWSDAQHSEESLQALSDLMDVCRSHLEHEDDFVHAAMEARKIGSSAVTAGDHATHLESIAAFLADMRSMRAVSEAQRVLLGERLYRRLALFVAENLEHMACEEVDNNAVLWALYTDEEILQIEHALVAAIPPEAKRSFMRWMLPAVSHDERMLMLGGMRREMPAEAFDGLLAGVRGMLSGREWRRLAESFGIAEDSTCLAPA